MLKSRASLLFPIARILLYYLYIPIIRSLLYRILVRSIIDLG